MNPKAMKWVLIGIVGVMGILRLASTMIEYNSIMNRAENKMIPSVVVKYFAGTQAHSDKFLPFGLILVYIIPTFFLFGAFLIILVWDLPAKLYQDSFSSWKLQAYSEELEGHNISWGKTTGVSVAIMAIFAAISTIYADYAGIYMGIGPSEENGITVFRYLFFILGGILGLLTTFFKPGFRQIPLVVLFLFLLNALFCLVNWSVHVKYYESQTDPQPSGSTGAMIQELASQYGVNTRFYPFEGSSHWDSFTYLKSPFTEFLCVPSKCLWNFEGNQGKLDPRLAAATVREMAHKINNDILWQKALLSIPSLIMSTFTALSLVFPSTFLAPWGFTMESVSLIPAIISSMCYTGALSTILNPFYLWWRRSREYKADEMAIAKGHGEVLATDLAAQWGSAVWGWEFSWLFEKLNMNVPSQMRRLENIDGHLAK